MLRAGRATSSSPTSATCRRGRRNSRASSRTSASGFRATGIRGDRLAPAGGRMTTRSRRSSLTPDNLGFLLAKASQRWNELLYHEFATAGFPEVRAAYGSLLVPLFGEDGLRQGELA